MTGHASVNRVREYRFGHLPDNQQRIEACDVCHQPFTVFTELHKRAHACTGCILRTIRPYDYTRPRVD